MDPRVRAAFCLAARSVNLRLFGNRPSPRKARVSRTTRTVPLRAMSNHPSRRTHISADTAAELDRRLMGVHAYSLDQLMELAGMSVACAVADFSRATLGSAPVEVAVVCGPGNNGGDGLVCARHLHLFGFKVCVICPVNRFPALTKQLEAFRIPIVTEIPPNAAILVDAVFGFSFSGPPVRDPFPALINAINEHPTARIVCVDVPSGWDVNKGKIYQDVGIRSPDAVVSLSAPKLCTLALSSTCRHYVGGRFVPPILCEELGFELPHYPDSSPIVLLQNTT
jgi:hydroxyethylthiazole kinase-like uncharacterized protein yjeF